MERFYPPTKTFENLFGKIVTAGIVLTLSAAWAFAANIAAAAMGFDLSVGGIIIIALIISIFLGIIFPALLIGGD